MILLLCGSLLSCHKDVEEGTAPFDSLSAAAYAGDVEAVEQFLEDGADLDERIAYYGLIPPLMQSVNNDDLIIAKILLDAGADVDVTMPENFMATMLAAAKEGEPLAADFILRTGVSSVDEFEGSLNEKVMNGSSNITSLWSAASKGQTKMVELLLQYQPDLEIRATADTTALAAAALIGYTTIVNLLLDNGAEINVLDAAGDTPLVTAAGQGHTEVVQLLLDHGADPELRRLDGGHGLMQWAADGGHIETLRLLLDNGIDIHQPGYKGFTAMHEAAFSGQIETLEFLLVNESRIDILADHDLTPLHAAAWEGRTEAVEWLIANGAEIEAKRSDPEWTAILIAARRGHLDIVRFLAEAGSDPDERTKENYSTLHAAAWNGDPNTVAWLIEQGADIEAVMSKSNRRPLHWAAERGHLEAVKILLDAGADPHAEADNAFTPRMLALHYEHADVASLIKPYLENQ